MNGLPPAPWFARQNSVGTWEIKVADREYAQAIAYIHPFVYDGQRFIEGDEETVTRFLTDAPGTAEQLSIAETALRDICQPHATRPAPPFQIAQAALQKLARLRGEGGGDPAQVEMPFSCGGKEAA